MARSARSDVAHLCARHVGRRVPGYSEKPPSGASDELPDFVARAVALGYSSQAAAALYQRIAQTRADIRARRITPAGGVRRVERLALAVDVATAVLKPVARPAADIAEAILSAAEARP